MGGFASQFSDALDCRVSREETSCFGFGLRCPSVYSQSSSIIITAISQAKYHPQFCPFAGSTQHELR